MVARGRQSMPDKVRPVVTRPHDVLALHQVRGMASPMVHGQESVNEVQYCTGCEQEKPLGAFDGSPPHAHTNQTPTTTAASC